MKFIIFGYSASGKTTYAKKEDLGKLAVGYTTRPKREDEIDKVDYKFISNTMFNYYQRRGMFIETNTLNGYKYAYSKNELLNKDVVILLPNKTEEVTTLYKVKDINYLIIKVDTPLIIRFYRQFKRGTSFKDIIKRYIEERKIIKNAYYDFKVKGYGKS